MYGADPEAVARLAAQLGEAACTLDTISGQISMEVMILASQRWKGGVADHFVQTWQQRQRAQLVRAAAFLREGQGKLTAQMDQQLQASAKDAGSSDIWRAFRATGFSDGVFAASAAMLFSALRSHGVRKDSFVLGRGGNSVTFSEGGASLKIKALHTELTRNWKNHSTKIEIGGVGMEKDAKGSYRVLLAPGIDAGRIHLSVGCKYGYNPGSQTIDGRLFDAKAVVDNAFGFDVGIGGSVDLKNQQAVGDYDRDYLVGDAWHRGHAQVINGVVQPYAEYTENQTSPGGSAFSDYFRTPGNPTRSTEPSGW